MSTCTSYRPGHQVHWIQARMATDGHRVTLSNPRGGLFDVTLPDGTVETWWNHDPEAVARACASRDAILARPGPMLRIPGPTSNQVLYPGPPPRKGWLPGGASSCHLGGRSDTPPVDRLAQVDKTAPEA